MQDKKKTKNIKVRDMKPKKDAKGGAHLDAHGVFGQGVKGQGVKGTTGIK
ncbi:MAG: hypothetical protein WAN04_12060 [Candidatus Udaeobacter sp.]